MSDTELTDGRETTDRAPELDRARKQPLATSYLPLWFLLAFAVVIVYGVVTK